jgi:adenosylcobinamide-phosphate synthase
MEIILAQVPNCILNPLIIGFVLDCILGDPYELPHPIRLFGKVISNGEKQLNKGKHKVLKGGLFTFTLITSIILILSSLLFLLKGFPIIKLFVESILVFYGIANRSLITECLQVERKLTKFGINEARKQLSMIVGRDTHKLSTNQIRIATLETLAENLSDGVIAPLFYYALGGVPLMFAYKIVNTMDSMIGYKNERFIKFGKVAAKTDDVINYIPARITAFLMIIIAFSWRGFVFIFKFGNKHSSPNAGYPEAALAGILNCRFGGANFYQGILITKPYIGFTERKLSHIDLVKACIINFLVALLFTVSILALFSL